MVWSWCVVLRLNKFTQVWKSDTTTCQRASRTIGTSDASTPPLLPRSAVSLIVMCCAAGLLAVGSLSSLISLAIAVAQLANRVGVSASGGGGASAAVCDVTR